MPDKKKDIVFLALMPGEAEVLLDLLGGLAAVAVHAEPYYSIYLRLVRVMDNAS
jgi:hypothetical protein